MCKVVGIWQESSALLPVERPLEKLRIKHTAYYGGSITVYGLNPVIRAG
jgi:hypothetical protein